jgi:hypothetical protein
MSAQAAAPMPAINIRGEQKLTTAIDISKKPLAKTPPLGWNSYDSYSNSIGEDETMCNLEIFAQKLVPFGYEYFVLDFGWYTERACIPGSIRSWRGDNFEDSHLDANGFPVSSRTYFPRGIRRIADRAHELGVKFGVHLFRGVIRKAWEFNLPVKGTPYRIRDIADTQSICSWCPLTYGVDMTRPGAQEYYDAFIRHVADMGIDFIKVDDLVPYPAEMEAVGKAVAKCDRDIVLSMSPGDDTTPANTSYYEWGHMLRISGDVWDNRADLDKCFGRWRDWQGAAAPGFWLDMDMLCLGTLGEIDPSAPDREKLSPEELGRRNLDEVYFRSCRFTHAQERTFMTMRALSASPLFMGGCLIRTEQRVLDLITNRDMLACNQNGVSATLQSECGPVEIWRARKRNADDEGWIGVFNRDEKEPVTVSLTPANLGLAGARYRLRGIWTATTVDLGERIEIAADDVLFVEYRAI